MSSSSGNSNRQDGQGRGLQLFFLIFFFLASLRPFPWFLPKSIPQSWSSYWCHHLSLSYFTPTHPLDKIPIMHSQMSKSFQWTMYFALTVPTVHTLCLLLSHPHCICIYLHYLDHLVLLNHMLCYCDSFLQNISLPFQSHSMPPHVSETYFKVGITTATILSSLLPPSLDI